MKSSTARNLINQPQSRRRNAPSRKVSRRVHPRITIVYFSVFPATILLNSVYLCNSTCWTQTKGGKVASSCSSSCLSSALSLQKICRTHWLLKINTSSHKSQKNESSFFKVSTPSSAQTNSGNLLYQSPTKHSLFMCFTQRARLMSTTTSIVICELPRCSPAPRAAKLRARNALSAYKPRTRKKVSRKKVSPRKVGAITTPRRLSSRNASNSTTKQSRKGNADSTGVLSTGRRLLSKKRRTIRFDVSPVQVQGRKLFSCVRPSLP